MKRKAEFTKKFLCRDGAMNLQYPTLSAVIRPSKAILKGVNTQWLFFFVIKYIIYPQFYYYPARGLLDFLFARRCKTLYCQREFNDRNLIKIMLTNKGGWLFVEANQLYEILKNIN